MTLRKIKLGPYWYYVAIIYMVVFAYALYGVSVTADEYEGGNPYAEFGANLAAYFTFPFILLWILITGGEMAGRYELVTKVMFVLNLVINFVVTAAIIEKVRQWVRLQFVRR